MEIETQSQALKDERKATKEARKQLDYYKGLAGMYQLVYDEQVEVSDAIMVIKGIASELKSELNLYQSKNGQDQRVIKAQLRLNILAKQLQRISQVQTDNYIFKLNQKKLETENHLLNCKIDDLSRQLQLHTENL